MSAPRPLPRRLRRIYALVTIASALADAPLARVFACGAASKPCAIFADWRTRFAALLAQIALLRQPEARG